MAILDFTTIADLKSMNGSKPLPLDEMLDEAGSGQITAFRFCPLGTESPPAEPLQPIDPTDVETVRLIDDYEQNKQGAQLPLEIYRFDNYYTPGGWPLIADFCDSRYVAGPEAHWNIFGANDWMTQDKSAYYQAESRTMTLEYTERQIVRVEEPVAFLTGPGDGVYGHWLLDFLPRLQIFQDCGILGKFKVVLPHYSEYPARWVPDFLDIYGIGESDIFRVERDRIYHWKTLFTPSRYHKDGWFGKTCQTAWSRMNTHYAEGLNLSKFPPRIYASRRTLGWNREGRVISDYPSLLNLFNEFDIHEFFPEEQDRQEQIAYFSNTDVVVGEDGSALHNCVFCRKQANMIVLAADTRGDYITHLGLANCMGLKVAIVQGPLTSGGQTFVIDMNRLRSLIEQACGRR